MKINTLRDVLVHELKDLHSAEKQLTKALPKMAKAAANEELAAGFEHHFKQTEEHLRRLDTILQDMGESARGPSCKAMEGLIEEGRELIEEPGVPEVKDALLISAAQRVEHYEIAAYGSARTFAEKLGEVKVAELLQKTLDEEMETDAILTKIARKAVNNAASAAS